MIMPQTEEVWYVEPPYVNSTPDKEQLKNSQELFEERSKLRNKGNIRANVTRNHR